MTAPSFNWGKFAPKAKKAKGSKSKGRKGGGKTGAWAAYTGGKKR
jgi:hypothetical protein